MLDPKLSETFYKDVEIIVNAGIKPIIVHGGGPQINQSLKSLKLNMSFIKE